MHLDGSPRIATLIELAQKHGVELPAYTEAGLRELIFKDHYDSLNDYLKGFPLILKVMQMPVRTRAGGPADRTNPAPPSPEPKPITTSHPNPKGAAERVAYEFGQDCIAEGVYYVEPRFAPQLLATSDADIVEVLRAVCAGLNRAKVCVCVCVCPWMDRGFIGVRLFVHSSFDRRQPHNTTHPHATHAKDEYNATAAVMSGDKPPVAYGVIVCAMRMFLGEFSPYYQVGRYPRQLR